MPHESLEELQPVHRQLQHQSDVEVVKVHVAVMFVVDVCTKFYSLRRAEALAEVWVVHHLLRKYE